MTRIILVRHGQTEWNRVERFRGRADVPLNETGRAQAELTARRIAAQRTSPEGQEGLRAFLEKREPGWREKQSGRD